MQHFYQQQRECKRKNISAISFQSTFVFNNISLYNYTFTVIQLFFYNALTKCFCNENQKERNYRQVLFYAILLQHDSKIYTTFKIYAISFGLM
jgi:hypothetical protein